MSLLARGISLVARQPSLINNLTNSMRALSVTPRFCQQAKLVTQDIAPVKKVTKEEQEKCEQVFSKVNQQLAKKEEGRLFAVVHLCGKQFKVTAGDIILVEGYWPPTIGDEIRLEKVLLAGAKDFTLIGAPLLEPGLVDVKATIIEKTLTHTKTHFKNKRRKQYLRINFQRSPNTMIRINSIEVTRKVDEPSKQPFNENRIF
ncbi:39S ribosomal protein L21, mitochondrial-like [Lucilia sericata]|uniref:39S ribosomal protein L21, mitochondrial-like n=1 Tax=Lucilia sericata TaxID=13632 RepID=UPI0018A85F82|nr:39S ribosomal protein L21, mitochondrial-like [Lucilia sericata]